MNLLSRNPSVREPSRRQRAVWPAMFIVVVCSAAPATAETPPNVTHIEEDWVVEIGVPDPDGHAPQILTAMASTNQLADVHAVFELNHRTLPSYTVGSMQMQIWSGDVNLDYQPGSKNGVLSNTNEVIRYTMRMRLNGGNIEFAVRNGTSTTWGDFGQQGWLRSSVATDQSSFTLYHPEVSVANSKVSYAKHRVKKFFLREVRYYTNNGELVQTDTTERVVHKHTAY